MTRENISLDTILPNLEEWAALASRFGAAYVENDVYGVRVPLILEAICEYLVGTLYDFHEKDKVSIDVLKIDLKRMINDEANRLGRLVGRLVGGVVIE